METRLRQQFEFGFLDNEEQIEEIRVEDSDVGTHYDINFNMPKLMLTMHQSATAAPKNHRLPIAVLALVGVSVQVTVKTLPDLMDI